MFYFAPINSEFYNKNNIDKNFPYNTLDHDIPIIRNGDNILLLGDFNARTTSNQDIILSHD